MALEDFFEDFVILNKISEPDGQGGVNWYLTEGARFRAGIHRQQHGGGNCVSQRYEDHLPHYHPAGGGAGAERHRAAQTG